MEQSLEQQHRSIHHGVRQRLEEAAGQGVPQFVPPYMQLPAEQLQTLHDSVPVLPCVEKAARVLMGSKEDTGDLPAFLRDILSGGPSEKTIAALLHYYTTHKVLQAVAAQRVRDAFPS